MTSTQTMKKCDHCGAPAPDDESVFCNRCGARLPAGIICRQCGKAVTDLQSRFCDRCGSPLAPAVLAPVPPITLAMGKICRTCGFENFVDDARFCKKCGSVLGAGGNTGAGPDYRPKERAPGTLPHGRDAVQQEPRSIPVTAPPGPNVPVMKQPKPVSAPGDVKDAGQRSSRRSYRKIALVIAIILLIVIVIALIFKGFPALSGNSAENGTAPDLPGILLSGIVSGNNSKNSTTPPGTFSSVAAPKKATVINGATPVVADTPLAMK